MSKPYDDWNRLKKWVDIQGPPLFPKAREVWVCHLGCNIGAEQGGRGPGFVWPVVIIARLNNRMVWCVPLAHGWRSTNYHVNFTDRFGNRASAAAGQIRMISPLRLARKVGVLDEAAFELIRENLCERLHE